MIVKTENPSHNSAAEMCDAWLHGRGSRISFGKTASVFSGVIIISGIDSGIWV